MNFLYITFYIAMIIISAALGIYNLLFALYSKRAKNELIIAIPQSLEKLLIINMFISFGSVIIILFFILRLIL
ncbi:MAG: hypothetical protein A2860_03330 [Candidatus Levybacteria bacterium RIFCSPHIGHO2_01_FULL_37_33]|nr:MAG: hypothetical protein A2860_03330 [Candidatus Levybacteria bacterium RIFCSPHIGHO2_01_FULL_37_33]OGH17456.1 MAG: hypothetical protein A3C97_03345 [Candidatus Levybacteria bacterium RIFCSPHIGHO2_02_FULL_37_11]OGH29896.1 MAG: hypothetical protein A3F30_01765 [Candidatus Levybacteria bacterium RIFCSPHIGHO2_12_FULL_37_12]OGH33003.1 MAG: hypothetical protein A2953_01125 [Candidatus Levybacteria bacterium RIFCSPLOWO2_01_FULL_36_54]